MKYWLELSLISAALFVATPCRGQAPLPATTAIDEYVHKADPAFEWKVVNESKVGNTTTLTVEMVSQNWLSPEQVNRTTWKH